jgi:hypothetical protein
MTRHTIATYGPKGRQVRVFTEGDLVRVQWRERSMVRTKSWANDAFATLDKKEGGE